MQQLWEAADFARKLQARLRFGVLSRADLKLLRFQLKGDGAECEWMARAADPWDGDLAEMMARKNTSIQALEDSLAVRNLLFHALPGVSHAHLQAFRQIDGADAELIIEGDVTREDPPPRNIRSLAMRARLCGFRFWLDDGVLLAMQPASGVAVRAG